MSDWLARYYQAIAQELGAEVDLADSLSGHPSVAGQSNEEVLRGFLARFIPRQYNVGTGFVLDRDGGLSKQCDIVVYDDFEYPSLAPLTSAQVFPIDVVRATIEIKTTLVQTQARRALENAASVRKLTMPQQHGDVPPLSAEDSTGQRIYDNGRFFSPPASCVFAYRSRAKQFETFVRWFTPSGSDAEPRYYPTLVGCLDQGVVRFRSTYPQKDMRPEAYVFPIQDETAVGEDIERSKGKYGTHKGVIHPRKKVRGEDTLIDQGRTLLAFLLYLTELLRIKETSPGVRFPIHYLEWAMDSAIKM